MRRDHYNHLCLEVGNVPSSEQNTLRIVCVHVFGIMYFIISFINIIIILYTQ